MKLKENIEMLGRKNFYSLSHEEIENCLEKLERIVAHNVKREKILLEEEFLKRQKKDENKDYLITIFLTSVIFYLIYIIITNYNGI